MTDTQPPSTPTAFGKALGEITGTVRAFVHSPRAMWGVNVPYFLEGIAYFGVLTLLMKYLSENIGLGDIKAGVVVSLFTGGITFAMFFLGELGDRYGLRRVLLIREKLEPGMVFTIEPSLNVAGRGACTIEEMVLVTPEGCEWLSDPQKKLLLIG